jgi:hypothetical protein
LEDLDHLYDDLDDNNDNFIDELNNEYGLEHIDGFYPPPPNYSLYMNQPKSEIGKRRVVNHRVMS